MIFCPLPGTYVVAQIDVQATLAGVEDPTAFAAASGMQPRKYLVYLHTPLQLPCPGGGPYKYLAYFVGPDPRPDEPENFITSDMCIPIYPNTNHPTGRAPVHPETLFPFTNCSHWVGWDLERKVRVLEGNYPDELSVKLSSRQHVDMESYCGEDLTRSHQAKMKHGGQTEVEQPIAEEEPAASSTDEASLAQISELSECSSGSLEDIDIFGLEPRDDDELLPVVKVWLDLAGHFADKDIPNPRGFVEESEAVIR
ncbi:hypothetical protein OH77DRAFT_1524768 [Trametes cingulata]|nr:hypothetical protein OH77DRAFT_1524768 [Trametes cingulata]